ncbi:MAG: hypothetical protein ACFFBS_10155 [Promethearchaeota archaeon]
MLKDTKSKTPVLLCPDRAHRNPSDADFCVRCGRDLDVADEAAQY